MPREYDADQLTWRIPLLGSTTPSDLPAEWTHALAAVGHDLTYRRTGRPVRLDNDTVAWELTWSGDRYLTLGMLAIADNVSFGAFSVGSGYALDTTPAQATAWAAEVLQDHLAGYEFVQWPSDGGPLLAPVLRGQRAVWIQPSTDAEISVIGELGSTSV